MELDPAVGAGESAEVAPHSLTAPLFAILVLVTAWVALALRDSVVWEGLSPFALASSSATSASACSTRVTGLSNRMIQMIKTAAVATPHHYVEHLEAEVEEEEAKAKRESPSQTKFTESCKASATQAVTNTKIAKRGAVRE